MRQIISENVLALEKSLYTRTLRLLQFLRFMWRYVLQTFTVELICKSMTPFYNIFLKFIIHIIQQQCQYVKPFLLGNYSLIVTSTLSLSEITEVPTNSAVLICVCVVFVSMYVVDSARQLDIW